MVTIKFVKSTQWPKMTVNMSMGIDKDSVNDKIAIQTKNVAVNFTYKNLVTTVDVTTFSIHDHNGFDHDINNAMASPEVASFLEAELNKELGDGSVLLELGEVLQKAANDYLKNNQQYPYGPLALVDVH